MTKTVVIFLALVTLGMPLIGSAREWKPLEDYSLSNVTNSKDCSLRFTVGRSTYYRDRQFIDDVISNLVVKGFTPYIWDFYVNKRSELVRLPYNPRPWPVDLQASYTLRLVNFESAPVDLADYRGGWALDLEQVAYFETYTSYQTVAYNEMGPQQGGTGKRKLLQMIRLLPNCIGQ